MPHHSPPKHPFRTLLNLVLALSAVYGLILTALLLVRNRLTENNKLIGIFNSFAHILMMPSMALLCITLWIRPWTAWFQVLPIATFIAAYGRRFVQKQAPRQTISTNRLTVLTFNLHGESEVLEPILTILRDSDAEIIALQELSLEAADCFKTVLADQYPHQALFADEIASRGQGILSRYPISAQTYWRNPGVARHSLGHLRVVVDFPSTPITVYNTHPLHPGMANDGFSTRPRGAEIDIVLEQAAKDSGAVLIMGDFNMTDQNEDYQRITAQFGDTFHAVGNGMGFTFPDLSSFQSLPHYWPLPIRLFPFLRLDYIFHNAAFQPIAARVWPTAGGSDHRPMWAELALLDKDHQ